MNSANNNNNSLDISIYNILNKYDLKVVNEWSMLPALYPDMHAVTEYKPRYSDR